MNDLTKILAMLIPTLIASLYGLAVIFRSSKSLFCRMPTLAFVCLLAGQTSYLVSYLSSGVYNSAFQIGFLGPLGSALFFISANCGSVASFFDDGTAEFKKSRWLALIAPGAVVLMFAAFGLYWYSTDYSDYVSAVAVYGVFTAVTCVSIYFTFKNVLLQDGEGGFIDCMRPYHIVITVLLFMWNVERGVRYISSDNVTVNVIMIVFYVILGVLTVAALPLLEMGRRKCLK